MPRIFPKKVLEFHWEFMTYSKGKWFFSKKVPKSLVSLSKRCENQTIETNVLSISITVFSIADSRCFNVFVIIDNTRDQSTTQPRISIPALALHWMISWVKQSMYSIYDVQLQQSYFGWWSICEIIGETNLLFSTAAKRWRSVRFINIHKFCDNFTT